LRLSDHDEPEPDLLILHSREDDYALGSPGAADVFLLVEVSDTTLSFDLREKLPLYALHGIPEVWIVDVKQAVILVHREPTPGSYRVIETRRAGERISAAAFPELEFAVADIVR
jgi:Uma2 family endonuclease